MPLKGRYTPADRPRNELEGKGEGEEEEEEEETLQYSQVHQSGTARPNGVDGDDGEFRSVEEDVDSPATGSLLKQFLQDQLIIYPRSVTQRSWKRRGGSRTTVVYQYYNPVTVVCPFNQS